MADSNSSELLAQEQEIKAKRAAYMREYRKKNPERQRALDKTLGARKKAKNPEKFLAQAKERARKYRERKKVTGITPEERERQRELSRERNRRYKERNPDGVKERKAEGHRRRYEANPDYYRGKAREAKAREYAKDPAKILAQVHRRRSKVKEGSVTAAEWRGIKARYGNRCAYCRAEVARLTMDHVQPLSKGGRHDPANVVPACQPCNNRKFNKVVPFPEPPADAIPA